MLSKITTQTTTNRQGLVVPPLTAITIAVIPAPTGTVVLIRADFARHPSILVEVAARGALLAARGGRA